MEDIHVQFEEREDVQLDEIDVGVADGTIAFDISGRITGLDEETLGQIAGKNLIPSELVLEIQGVSPE